MPYAIWDCKKNIGRLCTHALCALYMLLRDHKLEFTNYSEGSMSYFLMPDNEDIVIPFDHNKM
jgi:hypothetical protein